MYYFLEKNLLQLNMTIEDIKKDEEERQNVEIEQEEDMGIFEFPFLPNQIKIITQNNSIQFIIDKLEFGEVNLNTEFQRKFVWKDDKQSRLIESMLLLLPLPAFYFDEKEDNRWDVIDGLQRCSTLKHFVLDKTLRLKGLEFLKDLDGKNYEELPRELQRRIQNAPLNYYLIQKGTPSAVKYNLFKRINIGGEVLKPQEIRHALNQGIPADFVKELSELAIFKTATDNKIPTTRMQDRDFVTRFVAFYLKNPQEYQPDLDTFMHEAMVMLRKISAEQRQVIKDDFIKAMRCAWEVFGVDAFRKRQKAQDSRHPINKAIFETLSVNLAKQSNFSIEALIAKKEIFKDKFIELNNNSIFWAAISTATGQKSSVIERFKGIETIIREILEINEMASLKKRGRLL